MPYNQSQIRFFVCSNSWSIVFMYFKFNQWTIIMLCNILQKWKHSAKQAIPFILIQYTYMAYIAQRWFVYICSNHGNNIVIQIKHYYKRSFWWQFTGIIISKFFFSERGEVRYCFVEEIYYFYFRQWNNDGGSIEVENRTENYLPSEYNELRYASYKSKKSSFRQPNVTIFLYPPFLNTASLLTPSLLHPSVTS